MTWIFLTVIFAVIFWAGIIYWVAKKPDKSKETEPGTSQELAYRQPSSIGPSHWLGLIIAGTAFGVWLFVSGLMMFHTVGQREVAIVYNFSGTISGKKDPGLVTTKPWEHIKKENVGILHDSWDFNQGNYAVSFDQQQIGATLTINYQIDSANVVDLYKRVGPAWKSIIIDARVPQVFKETTATFTTPELTAKREQLRIATKNRLLEELAPYDIKVVDVFVRNLSFSDTYREAIEAKQKQVQDAQRAQAKVKQVEAEARQKVAEANGEAQANVARARGENEANRLRNKNLTAKLVQLAAIDKLNPEVQVIICPPQSVCIPNSGVVPQPGTP